MRADARANRDRILDIARAAFAADPDASLTSIAKTAGVGQGTLYRHFPSREALVVGVYRKEIDGLVALAPQLLTEHPPLQAFRLWCERLAEFGRIKQGVADVLQAAKSDRDVQETYGPMVAATRRLMDACEGAGLIRAGGDPEDVLLILSTLLRIPPGPAGEARAARLIAFVLQGLGADDKGA
ncbi:TetR/AcrR family transcriptional regulator [Acidisoma cellulosilytica]|uniref:TetR/AcrR family transcriptional regulator n=1 Tax=Acidisoma cellulosilyticum TaxID=2802395 RepID=A0A964E1V0_9PROT|nr:TetR/AcrR family transcriptional regulator [Acidisoma cellulosilyticum]